MSKYGNFGQFWGPVSSFDHIFVFFGYENAGIGERIMLLCGMVQKLLSSEVMPIYGHTRWYAHIWAYENCHIRAPEWDRSIIFWPIPPFSHL